MDRLSILDTLTLVGIIILGFISFLSLNFHFMADVQKSVIIAGGVALFIGLFAVILRITKASGQKLDRNIMIERIMVMLYIPIFGITTVFLSHSINVYNNRNIIQKELENNIDQARKMFESYEEYAKERIVSYKDTLDKIVSTESSTSPVYSEYGFEANSIPYNKQIDVKIDILTAKLLPNYYLSIDSLTGFKKEAYGFLDEAELTTQDDFAFMLKSIGNYKVIDTITNTWKNDLVIFSNYRAPNEKSDDFEYNLSFNNLTELYTTIEKPKMINWIAFSIIFLFIISPYLFERREERSTKKFFGGQAKSLNIQMPFNPTPSDKNKKGKRGKGREKRDNEW